VEGVKAAKKLAKSIMKESLYRNDVLLMDAYAQLERRGGKVEDSRRVCLFLIRHHDQHMAKFSKAYIFLS
jgi:hypothetical protein